MIQNLGRRFISAALMITALVTIVFILAHLAPGDPVNMIVDPDMGAAERAALRVQLGLDQPLPVQYVRWVTSLATGNLGQSLHQHRPVSEVIADALPYTLMLTIPAYIIHLIVACLLGVTMAVRRGTWLDRTLNIAGLTLYSLPAFWLGLMLILVFSLKLGWLPASGTRDAAGILAGGLEPMDLIRHILMPVMVLGVASAMGTARYIRSGLIEALEQDYIVAARARGISERAVVWRHALRNTLLPVVTLVGVNLPALLGGAVIVETVFAWPGMGRVIVEAIFTRDYPVILSVTAFSGIAVVLGNLIADLLYGLVDPRVRFDGEAHR
jgi:peptide/nickel transport system permease protein